VLDELEQLNRNDPEGLLTEKIDTARVGVFGHSFGGAVAAEVSIADDRFKAGINFDGLLFARAKAEGVSKPFLFCNDDTPIPSTGGLARAPGGRKRVLTLIYQDAQAIRRSLASHGGYWMAVRGASHTNFSDAPLYTPIKRLTKAGSIDARRA